MTFAGGLKNTKQRDAMLWLLKGEYTEPIPATLTLNSLRRRDLVAWGTLELTDAGRILAEQLARSTQGMNLRNAGPMPFANNPMRACADKDWRLWFPENGEPPAEAKALCEVCPVRVECLAYALPLVDLHGVWAGISQKARSDMRMGRRPLPGWYVEADAA